jgi:transcriptional regulator with XRE-family HTH domain
MSIPRGKPIPLDRILDRDPDGKVTFFEQSAALYVGSVIKDMREHADLLQKDLAKRVGTSQSYISELERGTGLQGPTFLILQKIAQACDAIIRLDVTYIKDAANKENF